MAAIPRHLMLPVCVDAHAAYFSNVTRHLVGGWFPASYTTNPTDEQYERYQNSQGGSKAASALAPPPYWMAAKSDTEEDTAGAVLYDVEQTDEEYDKVRL